MADEKAIARPAKDAPTRDRIGPGAEPDPLPPTPGASLPGAPTPGADASSASAPAEAMIGGETGEIPDLDSIDWGDDALGKDDGGGEDRKRYLILGGAAFGVLSIFGTAGWFILGGAEDESRPPTVAVAAPSPSVPSNRIEMAMPSLGATVNAGPPASGGPPGGGLAPPPATPRPGSLNAIGALGNEGAPRTAAETGGQVANADGAAEPGGEGRPPSPRSPSPTSLNALGAAAVASEPGVGIVVPSVIAASYAALPEPASRQPLATPDPALLEQGAEGPLPRIDGGRQPWQVFARPFDKADARPRVAVIVTGLGLSRISTEAAINRLPPAVTLAFNPYAVGVDTMAAQARAAGHELLAVLLLEPETFPAVDPGPQALMTTIEPAENSKRLTFALSRFTGYVGVVTSSGSRFNAVETQIRPVLQSLKQRGLMFVDGGAAQQSVAPRLADEVGVPDAQSNLILDDNPAPAAIDEQLAKLEILARQNKGAVAIGSPYPSTLARLHAWIGTLDGKGIALAPVSALADVQPKAGTAQARQ